MERPNEAKNLISNVILVILVVVSVFLAGTLAARYLTKGTGSDTARVAKWDVSAAVTPPAGDEGKTILPDGTSATGYYKVALTNNSEVAAAAKIEVAGIPAGMTVHVKNGTAENPAGDSIQDITAPANNYTAVLTGDSSWSMPCGSGTKFVYIYFTAASDVDSDKYGITITPEFTQID